MKYILTREEYPDQYISELISLNPAPIRIIDPCTPVSLEIKPENPCLVRLFLSPRAPNKTKKPLRPDHQH